jgi:hypothetical protein
VVASIRFGAWVGVPNPGARGSKGSKRGATPPSSRSHSSQYNGSQVSSYDEWIIYIVIPGCVLQWQPTPACQQPRPTKHFATYEEWNRVIFRCKKTAHLPHLIQLEHQLSIGIGSQSRLVDFIHVLVDRGQEAR